MKVAIFYADKDVCLPIFIYSLTGKKIQQYDSTEMEDNSLCCAITSTYLAIVYFSQS